MSMLSEEEKNEASVLIESVSAEERAELIHLTGGDYNTMTPLLIREYLWRKKNRRKLRGLSDDVREAEYSGFRLPPDKGKPYTYGTLPVSMAAETNPGSKEREAGHKASGVENLYSSELERFFILCGKLGENIRKKEYGTVLDSLDAESFRSFYHTVGILAESYNLHNAKYFKENEPAGITGDVR